MRKDCCGRSSVRKRVVRVHQGDSVALSDIDEPVRQLPVGVEATGHAQRAQPRPDFEASIATRRMIDEASIESCVVGGEHGAVEAPGQPIECLSEVRRAFQHWPGDAVDLGRTDTLQRPSELDECAPFIDDRAIALDDDGSDLQDAMAAIGEAGGLDVDDSEAGKGHVAHTRQPHS